MELKCSSGAVCLWALLVALDLETVSRGRGSALVAGESPVDVWEDIFSERSAEEWRALWHVERHRRCFQELEAHMRWVCQKDIYKVASSKRRGQGRGRGQPLALPLPPRPGARGASVAGPTAVEERGLAAEGECPVLAGPAPGSPASGSPASPGPRPLARPPVLPGSASPFFRLRPRFAPFRRSDERSDGGVYRRASLSLLLPRPPLPPPPLPPPAPAPRAADEARSLSSGVFLSTESAHNVLGGKRKRSGSRAKRGIMDECCQGPVGCSWEEYAEYCQHHSRVRL